MSLSLKNEFWKAIAKIITKRKKTSSIIYYFIKVWESKENFFDFNLVCFIISRLIVGQKMVLVASCCC